MSNILVRLFTAGSLGLLTSACATTSGPGVSSVTRNDCIQENNVNLLVVKFGMSTHNQKCADGKAAAAMISSDKPELQVVGAAVMRQQSPAVDQASRDYIAGQRGPLPAKDEKGCQVIEVADQKAPTPGKPPAKTDPVEFRMICG